MDITFGCESCGQRIAIDGAAAGQLVDCPTCGKPLEVPYESKPLNKPPTPSTTPLPAPAPPTDKKCPFCAETIKSEAIVCKHCGRDLVAKRLTEAVTEKVQGPSTATETPGTTNVVVSGIGCPRCGSHNVVQRKHTSGAGWGLFVGGIIAAFFTCGVGLILCVIGLFLNEWRGHCRDCGWVWKT